MNAPLANTFSQTSATWPSWPFVTLVRSDPSCCRFSWIRGAHAFASQIGGSEGSIMNILADRAELNWREQHEHL